MSIFLSTVASIIQFLLGLLGILMAYQNPWLMRSRKFVVWSFAALALTGIGVNWWQSKISSDEAEKAQKAQTALANALTIISSNTREIGSKASAIGVLQAHNSDLTGKIVDLSKKNFSTLIDQTSNTLDKTLKTLRQMTGDPNTPPYVWYDNFKDTEAELRLINPSHEYSVFAPTVTMELEGNRRKYFLQEVPPNDMQPFPSDRPSNSFSTTTNLQINFKALSEKEVLPYSYQEIRISCRAGAYSQKLFVTKIGTNKYVQSTRVYSLKDLTKPLFEKDNGIPGALMPWRSFTWSIEPSL